ncbi:MAG: PASTA domain-containing protein [Clostridiales Family XIII bacterium]|nr:PASTA domain-containing protein [Clostridiales Family XIII bacterium]
MNSKKKSKGVAKIRVAAVALALVCAIPASYFIYVGIQALSAPKEVALPDVVGKTEEEAKEVLDVLGIGIEIGDRVASPEIEEGRIVSQERPEGSFVKEGFTLRVNISRGAPPSTEKEPEEVIVKTPNLVGRSLDDARRALENYGYREGAISHENSELPVDYVVRQSPEPGVDAEQGARIDMVLSLGTPEPEKVAVPNLLGLTREAAARQLSNSGLTIGAISEEASDVYEEGQITGQQYGPEEEVDKGAAVNLRISNGAAGTGGRQRTVVIDIDFTDAPSEVFTLTVMLADSQGRTSTVIDRMVRYKTSGGDAIPVTGEGSGTVYVLFSGEPVMSYIVDFTSGNVSKI